MAPVSARFHSSRVVCPALKPAETLPPNVNRRQFNWSPESFCGKLRRTLLSSAEPRCYESTTHWEEQHLALGMSAACCKTWDKVLFVFSCPSACCALGSPAHLFMALMQKIVMAIIASGLLIAHPPSLADQRHKP